MLLYDYDSDDAEDREQGPKWWLVQSVEIRRSRGVPPRINIKCKERSRPDSDFVPETRDLTVDHARNCRISATAMTRDGSRDTELVLV